MKKLLVVAAAALGLIFGGATAANAGLEVCYDININGNQQAACQTVDVPPAPALP
jgi:hypothetical protein